MAAQLLARFSRGMRGEERAQKAIFISHRPTGRISDNFSPSYCSQVGCFSKTLVDCTHTIFAHSRIYYTGTLYSYALYIYIFILKCIHTEINITRIHVFTRARICRVWYISQRKHSGYVHYRWFFTCAYFRRRTR